MAFQALALANIAYVGVGPATGARNQRMFIYANPDGDTIGAISAGNYFLSAVVSTEVPAIDGFGNVAVPKLSTGDLIFVPSLGALLRLTLNSETAPTLVTTGVSNVTGIFGGALTADTPNSTVTPAALFTSGTLPVGRYRVRGELYYSSAATTTGALITLVSTGTAAYNVNVSQTLTATTRSTDTIVASGGGTATATSLTAGNVGILEGLVNVTVAGTLSFQFASEVAASAITALVGSNFNITPA